MGDDEPLTPSPPTYKPDNKRRLERTPAFHPDISLKRVRIEGDLRTDQDRHSTRRRDRDDDRSFFRHDTSRDTETDEMPSPPRKAPKTPKNRKYRRDDDDDDDHDIGYRSVSRRHSRRSPRKSAGNQSAYAEDDHNLALAELISTLSLPEIHMIMSMEPERRRLFLRLREEGGLGLLEEEEYAEDRTLREDELQASKTRLPLHKAEGLLDIGDGDSQNTDVDTSADLDRLYQQGKHICDDLEHAFTKLSKTIVSEPANNDVLQQFAPIAEVFTGRRTGQQFGMWHDHESSSRQKMESAFADAQAKLEAIQTKAGEAISVLQPAATNKKQLLEQAHRDFQQLFVRQAEELKELRSEVAPVKARFDKEIKKIPDEKKLKAEADQEAMQRWLRGTQAA